jgi:uncharacterized protein
VPLNVLRSIHDVAPEAWDRLACGDPFAGHAWLAALEDSGVTGPSSDWTACHALLTEGGEPVAACPLYVRVGNEGEFVWDEPIEEACLRSVRPYAPRAVSTVPWTPVAGPRLLAGRGPDRRELQGRLARGLVELCSERGWESVNVQFAPEDEIEVLREAGLVERITWQYHWRDRGYASFDDFLGRLRSRRRSAMRRELRELERQGISMEVRPGDRLDFERMATLYGDTCRRNGAEPALGSAFFEQLHGRMAERVVFFVATRGDDVVGMTLNVRHGDRLYGRFWGASEPVPFLHFNAAYHHPVRWCIEQGITAFEPGHGGEYKRTRGFDAVVLRSAHHFVDPELRAAVVRWAHREASWVQQRLDEKRRESPFAKR